MPAVKKWMGNTIVEILMCHKYFYREMEATAAENLCKNVYSKLAKISNIETRYERHFLKFLKW